MYLTGFRGFRGIRNRRGRTEDLFAVDTHCHLCTGGVQQEISVSRRITVLLQDSKEAAAFSVFQSGKDFRTVGIYRCQRTVFSDEPCRLPDEEFHRRIGFCKTVQKKEGQQTQSQKDENAQYTDPATSCDFRSVASLFVRISVFRHLFSCRHLFFHKIISLSKNKHHDKHQTSRNRTYIGYMMIYIFYIFYIFSQFHFQ